MAPAAVAGPVTVVCPGGVPAQVLLMCGAGLAATGLSGGSMWNCDCNGEHLWACTVCSIGVGRCPMSLACLISV